MDFSITNLLNSFSSHLTNNKQAKKEKEKALKQEENKPTKQISSAKPAPRQRNSIIADIKAFCDHFGEPEPGKTIEVTLKELLQIIPRHRPRIEAYNGLVGLLQREFNVTLEITSQKTKKNDNKTKKSST